MSISSWVITFSSDEELAERARRELATESRLEFGLQSPHQLAVVVDAPTADEDVAVYEWALSLPGVVSVDVVFVSTNREAHSTLEDNDTSPGE